MVDRRGGGRGKDSDGHEIGEGAGGEEGAFDVGLRGMGGLKADASSRRPLARLRMTGVVAGDGRGNCSVELA